MPVASFMDGERIDPPTLTSPEGPSLVGQYCLGPVELKVCQRQGTVWDADCKQIYNVFFIVLLILCLSSASALLSSFLSCTYPHFFFTHKGYALIHSVISE